MNTACLLLAANLWLAGFVCNSVAAEAPTKRAELEQQLFALEGTPQEFQILLAKAAALKVPKQLQLEARFLYYVDHQDEDALAAMASELRDAVAVFDANVSQVFETREAFLSAVFYAEALEALGRGDELAFEKAIKEAFWLGPQQGAIFAEPIERLRIQREMEKTRVDLGRGFLVQEGGGERRTLEQVSDGKDLILLHFWSPWHRECELYLPRMSQIATSLKEQGMATAFFLVQAEEELLPDARKMREPVVKDQVTWLLDRTDAALAQQLRVQNLPLTVVLDREGRVLFHGETGSPEMWEALVTLRPGLAKVRLKEQEAPDLSEKAGGEMP